MNPLQALEDEYVVPPYQRYYDALCSLRYPNVDTMQELAQKMNDESDELYVLVELQPPVGVAWTKLFVT